MLRSISNTPTWLLFFMSILPLITIYDNAIVWALCNIVIFTFFSIWLLSIVNSLLKKNRDLINLNKYKFFGLLFISLLYSIIISIYFCFSYNNYEEPLWIFLIIIPANVFLAYSYFFILNFIAKLIATVESQKAVTFENYAGYFFCLIFFPIGIWWLNPKIKSLLNFEV